MRVDRRPKDPRTPSVPGWYPDGSGHLRYFTGEHWTERQRPLPSYSTLPEFADLPPYQSFYPPTPKKSRLLRKVIGSFAALALILTAVSQLGSIWSPATQTTTTPSNFVPLITNQGFITKANTICAATLSPSETIAVTGAQVAPNGRSIRYLANPFTKLTAHELRSAISHNARLLMSITHAAQQFASSTNFASSDSAVTEWRTAWSSAETDLQTYNTDLSQHSPATRESFHSTERQLEWINVFATANNLTSCSPFSIQVFA